MHEIIEYDISGSLDTDEIYDMDELPQNVEDIERYGAYFEATVHIESH